MQCAPRTATPRRPERPTAGPAVAVIAERLGYPLLDWQRYVVDVALEVDVDDGRFAYDIVLLSVARQQGKTTLLMPWELVRLVTAPTVWRALGLRLQSGQKVLYTAQTGKAAEKKFRDDQLPTLRRRAEVMQMRKPRLSQGTMTIPFRYGSLYVSAPNDDAGRGGQLDSPFIDEARQQDDDVESGIDPAMATRWSAQKVITSNVGYRAWWRSKLAAGRIAAAADLGHGIAMFDWGAGHDDDPADPATWARALPSYGAFTPEGFPLVRDEFLAGKWAEACTKPGGVEEFKVEYLNIEPTSDVRSIGLDAWAELGDPVATMPTSGRWITADVAQDRTRAAVAVAAAAGDRVHVELVQAGAGTSWVAGALLELAGRSHRVRLDAYGPAGNLVAELQPRLRARLEVAGTADVARACGQLHDLVTSGRLRHRAQPELDGPVADAAARRHGDAWLWDRRTTDPAVLAVTLAADAASRPAASAPAIYVPAG